MSARIIIEYVNPPIPERDFDYVAYEDGYEPGAPQGYGSTAEVCKGRLAGNH